MKITTVKDKRISNTANVFMVEKDIPDYKIKTCTEAHWDTDESSNSPLTLFEFSGGAWNFDVKVDNFGGFTLIGHGDFEVVVLVDALRMAADLLEKQAKENERRI